MSEITAKFVQFPDGEWAMDSVSIQGGADELTLETFKASGWLPPRALEMLGVPAAYLKEEAHECG
jgi:hypothetical protein